MRSTQFKFKPFIWVLALLLACFLAYNTWGLSTQNTDLLKSMDSLEDNLKICTRKQHDLEEQLGQWKKKFDESQQESRKLSAELKNKETLINAQAEEASKWGDKVRILENDNERLQTLLNQKENESQNQIAALQKQLAESQAMKDAQLKEAQERISQLTNELSLARVQSSAQQLTANVPPSEILKPASNSSMKTAEQAPAIPVPDNQPLQDQVPEGRYNVVQGENQVLGNVNKVPDNKETDKSEEIAPENKNIEVPVLAVPNANILQQREIDLENDKKVDIPLNENDRLDVLNRPEDDENDLNDHEFEGEQPEK